MNILVLVIASMFCNALENMSLILCTNLGKFEFGRQNLVHEEIGIIRPGSAIWLAHTPKVAQLCQEISF